MKRHRVGRFEDAIAQLTEAEDLADLQKTSLPDCRSFLAMARHRLAIRNRQNAGRKQPADPCFVPG